MTIDQLSKATTEMLAACAALDITEIVAVSHGPSGSTLHVRLGDFCRVNSRGSVMVTPGGAYDQLSVDSNHFTMIAIRPSATLAPRFEVLP